MKTIRIVHGDPKASPAGFLGFLDADENPIVIHWVSDAQILNIFGDELLVDANTAATAPDNHKRR